MTAPEVADELWRLRDEISVLDDPMAEPLSAQLWAAMNRLIEPGQP